MAINSIGLSFFGPSKYEKTDRSGYDYADSNKRTLVRMGDKDSPIYLKWRTASGSDVNRKFDIAINYRAVPKVTTDGSAMSKWATDWSTWTSVSADLCNPQTTDGEGGYQWSYNFADLLNMCGIRDALILNGSFAFSNRYYDRIEFGIRIKSHYITGTDAVGGGEVIGPDDLIASPRTDDVFILDYVPDYIVRRVYCDSLDFVKVEYECSGWKRTDDRFCIEELAVGGESILASKPWGTITRTYDATTGVATGTAAIPVSSLTDLPIGEDVSLKIRFNPAYGAIGEDFATATYGGECVGGGAVNEPVFFVSPNVNGILEIKPQDFGGDKKPVTHCLVKLRGSDMPFDQILIPVNEWSALAYVPRSTSLDFVAVGISIEDTGDQYLSDPVTFDAEAAAFAPVEVVSLRDPSIRAMAKYDLAINEDYIHELTQVKLAGRDRECAYYGTGGSAAWSVTANLVKDVAGAYDTEEAWRKVAESGDCVMLLSDGTRRVVTVNDVRFNRSHPAFTSFSASLREVDA